jgi:hypothetical protein
MKNRMKTMISIVMFMITCTTVHAKDFAPLTGADSAAVTKAVLEIHAKMTAAAENPDPDKMFEFILDAGPGTIIQNGVFMKSRQDALESVRRGMRSVVKANRTYSQTRVTPLAPGAALLTGEGIASITLDDGRVISRPFALTEVFVLKEGKWMVLHGHHSVPPAQ